MLFVFKKILPLSIILFLIAGCAPDLLLLMEPTNDQLPKKLLPLEIATADKITQNDNYLKDVSQQSSLLTIFEREMKTNIIEGGKEKFGYIDVKLTYIGGKLRPATVPLMGLSVLSGFSLALLGTPMGIGKWSVQAEISIYDNQKEVIKKYTKTEQTKYVFGMYYGNNHNERSLLMFKSIIASMKKDLVNDVGEINSILLQQKKESNVSNQ
jgi:hypothetical protein